MPGTDSHGNGSVKEKEGGGGGREREGRVGKREGGGGREGERKKREERRRKERGRKGRWRETRHTLRSQSYGKRFTYCAIPEEDGSGKEDKVPQEHPVVHLGVLIRDKMAAHCSSLVPRPQATVFTGLVWEQEYWCREILKDI